MEAAFAEMPLALFSTLSPMGAGAFVILSIANMTNRFDSDDLKKIDHMTIIAVALVLVGFIAAFFHLANPLNAIFALSGIGESPLSNELAAGCVFTILMLIYWIWAMTGKMTLGMRKALSIVVAVAGVIFAFFTGLAYMIDTIPSWNTAAGPVQMVGFSLMGGTAVGVAIVSLAGFARQMREGSLKTGTIIVFVVGLVLGLGAFAIQAVAASGMSNALFSGTGLIAGATVAIVCGVICLAATGVCDFLVIRGGSASVAARVSVGAIVLAAVGILLMRLAFYSMQLSVGLAVM